MFLKRSMKAIHLSSLLLGGTFARLSSASEEKSGGDIRWGPCDNPLFTENPTAQLGLPIECGNLDVPLDYTQPDSNSTLELKLLRAPALKQPAKGSIIVHFGGPAAWQRKALQDLAEQLHLLTGQGFNLVTWDQRGTAGTLPLSCFNTSAERILWYARRANLAVTPADEMEFNRNWAIAGQHAQQCADFALDRGADVVGTVDTARDIMEIVDALGGDRKLRFYGLSYGTVVGSTVAALFPERIERLVLDGVSNPHQWYAGEFWEMQTDSDKVVSGFLRTCFEKPELCLLASENPNSTAAEIESKLYDKIQSLKTNPIPFTDKKLGPVLIDQNLVKGVMRSPLYAAAVYPLLSQILHYLLIDDLTAMLETYATLQGPDAGPAVEDDASVAVGCSDSSFRADNIKDAIPLIEKNIGMSRFFGDILSSNVHLCAQWKLPLKEKFERGFHEPIELATPPLIFGNEYDVVTPYVSARNISESFPGSVAVEYKNAFGHGILRIPSMCTANAVREYFEDGTLPQDPVCEQPGHPWENTSWKPLWSELGYERPNSTAPNSVS